MSYSERVASLFKALGIESALNQSKGFATASPADGSVLAHPIVDTAESFDQKLHAAWRGQKVLSAMKREQRAAILEAYAAGLRQHREALGELITLDGGKTPKEGLAEADGSADILLKTIKDAALAEFNGMLRCKERVPAGVVGLITSFNFPMVVAHWTIGPAILAGNAVLWKPSEKTPLVAIACKAIFDKAAAEHSGLLQVLIGGRDIGQMLVSHEMVDVISATGSVAMGKGIEKALAAKKNKAVKPILELGGNNAVVISDKMSPAHLEWSLKSLLNSFFGTTGQRCTNTRRVFIQQKRFEQALQILSKLVEDFIASNPLANPANEFGYGPLIDEDAFKRFEYGKKHASDEGGKILFGKRLLAKEHPHGFYVEPALAIMPSQTSVMQEEVFAPLLFIAPYDTLEQAITMVNAPANAGLTNGIYTQNQQEADLFAAKNEAGHTTINSPKGTGTPAFGMGFGGNKDSGTGEILNTADPLRPFTREGKFTRVAQNKDIVMNA